MRKLNLSVIAGALVLAAVFSGCSDDNNSSETAYKTWDDNGAVACDHILFGADGKGDPKGTVIGNGDQEFVFKGKQTLKKGTYTLKGWVYIGSGAELTIEPGTVIKGDKLTKASLIVEPGGKLIAQGSASEPIVFTSAQAAGSRRPGDWGGVVILGKARNNKGQMTVEGGLRTKHGGDDDADNSGVLSYVRIEFAGYPFKADQEINGLTLGSVGSGTKIDHVQVSYSNDDSFEWFGGDVNCKYLVAYKGWDDDFDTDNGFSGKVQFGLSVRDPRIADGSQSNGFESDNCSDGAQVLPYTAPVFSNITFVGPKTATDFVNDNKSYINAGAYFPNNGSSLGKFQSGMHIRRSSRLNCVNSVITDWPIGLILDGEKGDTPAQANAGKLRLQNIYIANTDIIGSDANKCYEDKEYDYKNKKVKEDTEMSLSHKFFLAQPGNKYFASKADMKLTDGKGVGVPFMPQAGSILFGAQNFSGLDSWFTTVNYIGAFAEGDKWLDGWTNFDPQNTKY